MKFVSNLVFWTIVVIVCMPILFFAPAPFLIFTVCFLAFCIGLAVFSVIVDGEK